MRVASISHELCWKGGCQGKPSIIVNIMSFGKAMSSDDVVLSIRRFKACSRVVFSGVDPLVDQMDVVDVINRLQDGWEIIVETTGGVMPDIIIRDKVSLWVVNPLVEGASLPFVYNVDALRFFVSIKNSFFEWVVGCETDLLDVKKTVHFNRIPWKRVILSPLFDDFLELDDRFDWIKKFCLEKGCIMGNPLINNLLRGERYEEQGYYKRDSGLLDSSSED